MKFFYKCFVYSDEFWVFSDKFWIFQTIFGNFRQIFGIFSDEILNYIRSLEERLGLTDYPEADSFMNDDVTDDVTEAAVMTSSSSSRPDAVSNAFKVLSIQENILQETKEKTRRTKRTMDNNSSSNEGEEEEEEGEEELGEGERALVQEICKVRARVHLHSTRCLYTSSYSTYCLRVLCCNRPIDLLTCYTPSLPHLKGQIHNFPDLYLWSDQDRSAKIFVF